MLPHSWSHQIFIYFSLPEPCLPFVHYHMGTGWLALHQGKKIDPSLKWTLMCKSCRRTVLQSMRASVAPSPSSLPCSREECKHMYRANTRFFEVTSFNHFLFELVYLKHTKTVIQWNHNRQFPKPRKRNGHPNTEAFKTSSRHDTVRSQKAKQRNNFRSC